MEKLEAIDILIRDLEYTIEAVENGAENNDIYQLEKRRLEASLLILGELDPKYSTIEGVKERLQEIREAEYPEEEEEPEPCESEKELFQIVSKKENDLELKGDEDNQILSKILKEDDLEESDENYFAFYGYAGRVFVVFEVDRPFWCFSEKWRKKALELVKKQEENG